MFSGEDHHGEDASDGNLERADLSNCNLRLARFVGANLASTRLDGASLAGAWLNDADLTGAHLWGANLEGARLNGADLQGADLTDADLTKARLRGALVSGAILDGADLSGADLTDACLVGASLVDVTVSARTILPAGFTAKAGVLVKDRTAVVQESATCVAAPAYPWWWPAGVRACGRCSVPLAHKHQVGQEVICTACLLHDRASRLTGDVQGAVELMNDRGICAYCGEHVDAEETIKGGPYADTLTVKICVECTELSPGKDFASFPAKREALRQALRSRYAHLATAREWDPTELAELSPNLRLPAALQEQGRRIVQGRLEFDFTKLIGL